MAPHFRAFRGGRIAMPIAALLALAPLFALESGRAESAERSPTESVRVLAEALSIDSLFRHAEALGNDSMEGRRTGEPGGDRAAAYIAAELGRFGLRPMGDAGSFLQRVPMRGASPLPESRLEIVCDDTSASLALEKDYLLFTIGEETFVPKPAPLLFVGYGIVAAEFDYNDYQELDVAGSIVVFLEGEPASDDPRYFDGPFPTVYARPEMKQRVALARGALGSVMIPIDHDRADISWDESAREFGFEHVSLLHDVPRSLNVLLRGEPARLLFRKAPRSLDDVLRMDREGTVRSFPLVARMSFHGAYREREFFAANVLGLLEGSDPLLRESCVLLSAHYDHLGIGPAVDGDSIYNGVVDNALGCAGLLEIARVLAGAPNQPLRPILFLFSTGEEEGLLGSRHYVLHPAAPLGRTIANVNIQGLAIFDTFDDVIGVGSELSTIGDFVERAAAELGLSVSAGTSTILSREAFARSDQAAFAEAGVPAVLLVDGVHARHLGASESIDRLAAWVRERYHTPFDDLAQPIDRDAVLEHAQAVLVLARALSDSYEPPQWKAGARYAVARLRSIAEGR